MPTAAPQYGKDGSRPCANSKCMGRADGGFFCISCWRALPWDYKAAMRAATEPETKVRARVRAAQYLEEGSGHA